MLTSETVEHAILLLRGHRVMLDENLAELYGVPVKVLTQAVKRNVERFPNDFVFRLSLEETQRLRSQIVTLDAQAHEIVNKSTMGKGRGKYRKYLPYAFTEQGVAMLSSVLRSPRAVQVNIDRVCWLKSTSDFNVCARSCACGRCCNRTPSWHASSHRWKRNTMLSSRSCSTPSAS
jgi:hypothetical protein